MRKFDCGTGYYVLLRIDPSNFIPESYARVKRIYKRIY